MRSISTLHHAPVAAAGAAILALVAAAACGDTDTTDPGEPEPVTLTVSLAGDGAGTVTSTPTGITCGPDDTPCETTFDEGTQVTLTATPAASHEFAGWSGACTGTAACQVTLSTASTVEAGFDDPALETAEIGPDGGTLVSSDGRLTLEVPAGALGTTEILTIAAVDAAEADLVFVDVEDSDGEPTPYELGPDGLTFSTPVTLSFETGDTVTGEGLSSTFVPSALYTTSGGNPEPLADITFEVDPESGALTVVGSLSHFSPLVAVRYAGDADVRIGGVPDALPVGGKFTAIANVDTDERAHSNASFRDNSVSPVVPDFGDDLQSMDQLTSGGTFFSTAELPYTCVAEGEGLFRGTINFSIYPDFLGTSVPLNVELAKPVECVVAPDVTHLAGPDGEPDGVAGVVTDDGQVAGRSAGSPAFWTDPASPPELLPAHPDNTAQMGFVFAGSADGSRLGGIVFDDAFRTHAAVWSDGEITLIEPEGDPLSSSILGMSPNGMYAGGTASYEAGSRPFVYSDGIITFLDLPESSTGGNVHAINDAGIAVGQFGDADGIHATAWDLTDGSVMELPAPPFTGPSVFRDINAHGTMVGNWTDPETGVQEGIIYGMDGWVVVPSDGSITPSLAFDGIADNGVIACHYRDFDNNIFRACVTAEGENVIVLDLFDGANTLPGRRGISRNGMFFVGGTENDTGAYADGWIIALNALYCPGCN